MYFGTGVRHAYIDNDNIGACRIGQQLVSQKATGPAISLLWGAGQAAQDIHCCMIHGMPGLNSMASCLNCSMRLF